MPENDRLSLSGREPVQLLLRVIADTPPLLEALLLSVLPLLAPEPASVAALTCRFDTEVADW